MASLGFACYSKCLTPILFIGKWNKFCVDNYGFRNGSNYSSSFKHKHAIIDLDCIYRRTISSLPALSKNVDNKIQFDVEVLNGKQQENSNRIQQTLSRVDLDLRKHGRLSREDVESIIKEMKNHDTVTSTQGLYIIRCCGWVLPEELPQYRIQLVKEVWDLLLNTRVHLDISHFNALLLVYLENEYYFNPMKFLASIIELDILPNKVTYQRLVAAYCQKGDLNGAAKILDILKHKDITIDARIFNAIVMGHSVIGDWESAKEIVSAMLKNGLEPEAETYRELLCGYAMHGVSNCIESLIDECKKKEITFNDEDLFAVLYTAAVHGHSEIVDILLGHMKKSIGYNRICVNVILQLITQNKEDEAFKILLTMKPRHIIGGRVTTSGNFFIYHLVKKDCPYDKIVSFCQQLVQSGKNFRAFITALEAASRYERTELVNFLLNTIKSDKNNSRPYLLGHLLTSEAQIGGEKKVLEMLRKMAAIRLHPNVDIVKRHVLPHMTGDSQTLLRKLLSARVSFFVIAISLLQQSLESLDFDDAIRITSTFYVDLDSRLRQNAVTAYLKSRNAIGLAKLIRSLLPEQEEGDVEWDSKDLGSQLIGPILREICELTPKAEQLDLIEPFLEALREQGLSISLSAAQFVRETLEVTSPVSDLLAELSSGELIPKKLDPRHTRLQWPSSAQIIKRKSEFSKFARERKLDEALASKKEIESRNIPFTDGMNVLLMDLYAHHGYLDEALAVFSDLFSRKSDLVVFPAKVMGLATQLLKGDRINDALDVLQKLKADHRTCDSAELSSAVNRSAMRLMNTAAEKGDVQLIQNIFGFLEESKSLKIGNSILGSLVKVHVVREDVESALDEFDRCTKRKCRATPWISELAVRLIQKDDTKSLDRLMLMNSKVHGEMNSLYDLSLAFLRCDRVSQAKKVLQTPGLRALNNRLNDVCAYYVRKKRIDELENLVKITKNLFNVDRNMLFDHLLSAYIQADEPARAVAIWTLMQEESDVVPRDDFLQRLASFLTSKNLEVPFVVPISS